MRVLVVGTGAGGAMAAKKLSAAGHEVHVLEAGDPFKALTRKVMHAGALRRTGLLGSERTISRLFPHMRTARSGDLVMVRGVGAGGCTTISCGNILPAEKGLKEIGLDLSREFGEIIESLHPCIVPRERWRPTTSEMFDVAQGMGLNPALTPKALAWEDCIGCGMCELGCATGARWDSRAWVKEAVASGAQVHYGHEVRDVVIEDRRAIGVHAMTSSGVSTIKADRVVLAAGGIGTAQILRRTGTSISDTLWIDPVFTFGGMKKDSEQLDEMPMVWYAKKEDFIISPYLDLLSHFFQPSWRRVGIDDRVGVMVKLADEANGRVDADGNVAKSLSGKDEDTIKEAGELVEGIMTGAGVKGPITLGMINGGHLGGTVPLHRDEVEAMHPAVLPENLWVADLSLVPRSQGMPTMVLAAAIASRVCSAVEKSYQSG